MTEKLRERVRQISDCPIVGSRWAIDDQIKGEIGVRAKLIILVNVRSWPLYALHEAALKRHERRQDWAIDCQKRTTP
jgi:hypothetical protein